MRAFQSASVASRVVVRRRAVAIATTHASYASASSSSSCSAASSSRSAVMSRRAFSAAADESSGGGVFGRLKGLWSGGSSGAETTSTATTASSSADSSSSERPAVRLPPTEEKKEKSSLTKLGEKAMNKMKGADAVELENRLKNSQWDLETYKLQLLAQQSAGQKANVLKYIPAPAKVKAQLGQAADLAKDETLQKFLQTSLNLIDSMTAQQRADPSVFERNAGLPKLQLAKKVGVTSSEVQAMLDQYTQLSIIFKHMFELRGQGVEFPDDYDGLMKVIMSKAKFTPKEMQFLGAQARREGLGMGDQISKMAQDGRTKRKFTR